MFNCFERIWDKNSSIVPQKNNHHINRNEALDFHACWTQRNTVLNQHGRSYRAVPAPCGRWCCAHRAGSVSRQPCLTPHTAPRRELPPGPGGAVLHRTEPWGDRRSELGKVTSRTPMTLTVDFIHHLPFSCSRRLCHNDGISVIRNLQKETKTALSG